MSAPRRRTARSSGLAGNRDRSGVRPTSRAHRDSRAPHPRRAGRRRGRAPARRLRRDARASSRRSAAACRARAWSARSSTRSSCSSRTRRCSQHAESNIREHGLNAEWALQRELRRLEELFESMPDPYLRERASDIGFIVRRVLQALMGREPEGLRNAPPGVIVVAEDLSPGEVAQVDARHRRGRSSPRPARAPRTSRSWRAASRSPRWSARAASSRASSPTAVTLIVDGRTGRVIVDPDPSTIAEYQKQLADLKALSQRADALRRPARRDQGRRARCGCSRTSTSSRRRATRSATAPRASACTAPSSCS